MADINALKTAFFVNVGDVVQAAANPTDPDIAITASTRPQTEQSCRATHLIDGSNYFTALRAEVNALLAGGTDRFFFSAGWQLGTSDAPDDTNIGEGSVTSAWQSDLMPGIARLTAFELQDDAGPPFHPFHEDIKAMAAAGVDVRFLAWASPFIVNFEEVRSKVWQPWSINVHTLRSAVDLRQLPGMHNKVVLNTLAHTLSAMHIKMVVCGDSTGFRGYASGIDFVQNRNTPPVHDPDHFWHDLTVKVEGAGADGLHKLFVQLWNEQVRRSPKTFKAFGDEIKSHVDDTELLDEQNTPAIAGGPHHTQVLRTLPTMNFTFFGTERVPVNCIKRLVTGFKQSKISFAEDGIFEFRAAQRKALFAAEKYVYIEDQAFWNFEVADWLNARLKAVPALKVILMHMGDPLDPPSPLIADFVDRIAAGVATPGDRVAVGIAPYTIHSKVTIIDDKWASIGSSNCIRRSFYMEGEVSVSVLDEGEPAFAANLRKDLWGEHCGVVPGPACDPLLVLDDALGIWNPAWGSPPAGFGLRADVLLKAVPFIFMPAPVDPNAFEEPRQPSMSEDDRSLQDGDSRMEY